MKVLVPRLSGFCPGVRRAERKLFEEKKKHPMDQYYLYGYLINNRRYIEFLEKNDIRIAEAPEKLKKGERLIIRTHGISREEGDYLKKQFSLVDLTCRNVKRVQLKIQRYTEEGFFTFLTGKKTHPEIRGLVSYARGFFIAETEKDIDYFIREGDAFLSGAGPGREYEKILVVSQTTGDRNLFRTAALRIKRKWEGRKTIQIFNSICPLTVKKEEEALRLQKEADISFVVGDRLSSNAGKLYKTLCEEGGNVHFIEDAAELKSLNLPLSEYKSGLVVSSASTPSFVEREVVEFLAGI